MSIYAQPDLRVLRGGQGDLRVFCELSEGPHEDGVIGERRCRLDFAPSLERPGGLLPNPPAFPVDQDGVNAFVVGAEVNDAVRNGNAGRNFSARVRAPNPVTCCSIDDV